MESIFSENFCSYQRKTPVDFSVFTICMSIWHIVSLLSVWNIISIKPMQSLQVKKNANEKNVKNPKNYLKITHDNPNYLHRPLG